MSTLQETVPAWEALELLSLRDEENSRPSFTPEKIASIREILIKLHETNDEAYGEALRKFADYAKEESWRDAVGTGEGNGLLGIVLEQLDPESTNSAVQLQALRFIGNCCIDHDDNRMLSKDYLQQIGLTLRSKSLVPVATSVIYNMCIDNEAVQDAAAALRLEYTLTALLYRELASDEHLSDGTGVERDPLEVCRVSEAPALLSDSRRYMVDLILLISQRSLVTTQATTAGKPSDLHSRATLMLIFAQLCMHVDMDELDGLVTVILASVIETDEDLTGILARYGDLMITLEMLEVRADAQLPEDQADASGGDVTLASLCRRVIHGFAQLSDLGTRGQTALADISGLRVTAASSVAEPPIFKRLRIWLRSDKESLKHAACYLLGNMAMRDDVCTAMVYLGMHHDATRFVIHDTSLEVKYVAAGWLRHLTCVNTKEQTEHLLEGRILEACLRLISMEDHLKLQIAGMALLRAVARDSLLVSQLLLGTMQKPEYTMGAESLTLAYITRICSALNLERPFNLPLLETGARIPISVARCIIKGAKAGTDDFAEERQRFFDDENVIKPIITVLQHTQSEHTRAECWFGMALMASCAEGGRVMAQRLGVQGIGPEITSNILKMYMKEISSEPGGRENALRLFRQNLDNAMIVNDGILKHGSDILTEEERYRLRKEIELIPRIAERILGRQDEQHSEAPPTSQ